MLFAILALSLTFSSCADNSDADDENPTPSLPENVGKNPIKETIKLKRDTNSSDFLELNADGTALYIRVDDEGNAKETERSKYKYSYDDKKETIAMVLEKSYYGGFFIEEEGQLLAYDDLYSKINKDITVEKLRQFHREYYKENKDDKYFREDYPDCNSYEDFEKAVIKEMNEMGFDSFDAYIKFVKQEQKNYLKAMFGVKITYAYKIEGGKMTLTEKFTGLKNMVNSECCFIGELGVRDVRISFDWVSIRENDDWYDGTPNIDKKTISLESVDEDGNREKVNATYTEDIEAGTVTVNFKGKNYVCEFEGDKYIQVE